MTVWTSASYERSLTPVWWGTCSFCGSSASLWVPGERVWMHSDTAEGIRCMRRVNWFTDQGLTVERKFVPYGFGVDSDDSVTLWRP